MRFFCLFQKHKFWNYFAWILISVTMIIYLQQFLILLIFHLEINSCLPDQNPDGGIRKPFSCILIHLLPRFSLTKKVCQNQIWKKSKSRMQPGKDILGWRNSCLDLDFSGRFPSCCSPPQTQQSSLHPCHGRGTVYLQCEQTQQLHCWQPLHQPHPPGSWNLQDTSWSG